MNIQYASRVQVPAEFPGSYRFESFAIIAAKPKQFSAAKKILEHVCKNNDVFNYESYDDKYLCTIWVHVANYNDYRRFVNYYKEAKEIFHVR